MPTQSSRRHFLGLCAGTAALTTVGSWKTVAKAFGASSQGPYQIGICDWDLQLRGNPQMFALARELGFEGVQVSYEPEGEFSLAKPENDRLFLDAAKNAEVAIASLAMGLLNGRPLATVPEAEGWVAECIKAMSRMGVDQALLAFFAEGDIKEKPEQRAPVIEKLKRLAPQAEAAKKILGIESYLDAREHLKMLEAIGSDAVKVYYDEQNMLTQKYPIYEDLELLLKEKAICQIHAKEYDHRLGEGPVDFPRIRKLLEKYDYRGWVVVESAVRGDWKESQAANAAYLKKTFRGKENGA